MICIMCMSSCSELIQVRLSGGGVAQEDAQMWCRYLPKWSKCSGSPPPPPVTLLPCGNIGQGYFVIGYYCNTTWHSKQLPVGFKIYSDGMVHCLWSIEKNVNKSTKTILWAISDSLDGNPGLDALSVWFYKQSSIRNWACSDDSGEAEEKYWRRSQMSCRYLPGVTGSLGCTLWQKWSGFKKHAPSLTVWWISILVQALHKKLCCNANSVKNEVYVIMLLMHFDILKM